MARRGYERRARNHARAPARGRAGEHLDGRDVSTQGAARMRSLPVRATTARDRDVVARMRDLPVAADEIEVEHRPALVTNVWPFLMTTELKVTIAEHAAGNYRVMMNIAESCSSAPPNVSFRDSTKSCTSMSFSPHRRRRESPRKRSPRRDDDPSSTRAFGRPALNRTRARQSRRA